MNKKKTISQLKKSLQRTVNEYIRLRDQGRPCISCGEPKILEAGHFYPKSGYDGLRFDEDNIHGECPRCNRFDQSHLIGYNDNLRQRIGEDRLNALKMRAAAYKKDRLFKWTRHELEEIKLKYQRLLRTLK